MAHRARLFRSGSSQAVRLPKEYRFEGQEEVLIHREGNKVILEPAKRTWSRKFLALAGSAEDFPYPEEPLPAEPGPDLQRPADRPLRHDDRGPRSFPGPDPGH